MQAKKNQCHRVEDRMTTVNPVLTFVLRLMPPIIIDLLLLLAANGCQQRSSEFFYRNSYMTGMTFQYLESAIPAQEWPRNSDPAVLASMGQG